MQGSRNGIRRSRLHIVAALVIGGLALPTIASAHLERPSYWPDPTPDTDVSPPAGGEVPKARSLGSAVTGEGPGKVRVVCEGNSLDLAKKSIAKAHDKGFRLRPSQPKTKLSGSEADKLLEQNKAFAKMCSFDTIQPAIDKSGNNDRVVIMPGRYTEPKSRKAPVNDPECFPSLLQSSQSGAQVPSYEYQSTCPHDQNLLYVQGRAIEGDPLPAPDPDRHGIPEQELGDCIKCNFQIEGSGARPEDVLLDAGRGYEDSKKPTSQPGVGERHDAAGVPRRPGRPR